MKKFLLLTLLVAMMATAAGCGSSSTPNETTPAQQQQQTSEVKPPKANVSYEIVKINDVSTDGLKEFDYYVWVKEQADEDELKLVSRNVTEQAKKDTPFNILTVYLFDRAEYITENNNKTATLGYAVYTVDGDKKKAGEAKTGEYDKMSYDWELRDVDWSKRPTDSEMKVYTEWDKAKNWMKEKGEDISDSEFAQKIGIETDKLKDIVEKNIEWIKDRT